MDTRRSFHRELQSIRDDLLRAAALVTESITRGTQALLDGDLGAARELIAADIDLNRVALDVEDRCYHQLALQQPMAGDLRALVTAIRMCSELERSGDLMVNVAKGATRIAGTELDPKVRGLLQRMSDEALHLYRCAIDAYADADEVTAAALDVMDDTLDQIHRDYIDQVLRSCRAGTIDIQPAVQLALVGRYYERIGDHAVNIGEKVRYLVSGWLPSASTSAQR